MNYEDVLDYASVAGPTTDFVPQFGQPTNSMDFYSQGATGVSNKAAVDQNLKPFSGVPAAPTNTPKVTKWIKGVKRDFLPLSIQSMLYEPPKPDTPPSRLWPFGFDPIWSEDVCSPTIDIVSVSFNSTRKEGITIVNYDPFQSHITLPFIPPGTPPIVITPDHLKIINYKCFDFDAAYRDLIGKS